jgi:hypothetical protein
MFLTCNWYYLKINNSLLTSFFYWVACISNLFKNIKTTILIKNIMVNIILILPYQARDANVYDV